MTDSALRLPASVRQRIFQVSGSCHCSNKTSINITEQRRHIF